jgi:cobalt/nickel transport system permease protein
MGHAVGGGASGLLDPANERRNGFVAGLDPRVRVIVAAAFAVAVVSFARLDVLALALAIAFVVMLLAHLPIVRTIRRVMAMDAFIIFMIAMLPFTVPGEPVFELFGMPASREGFLQAFTITLKATAIVTMAMTLLGSMEAVTLARALRSLGMPDRLVHLILFTVRYIDVLHLEYRRLRTAMKARGFRPSNTRHTYVSFGYLIGMMLVRALERSERILQAMKCRGFSGRFFLESDWRLRGGDLAFSVILTVLIAGLVYLEAARVGTH